MSCFIFSNEEKQPNQAFAVAYFILHLRKGEAFPDIDIFKNSAPLIILIWILLIIGLYMTKDVLMAQCFINYYYYSKPLLSLPWNALQGFIIFSANVRIALFPESPMMANCSSIQPGFNEAFLPCHNRDDLF